MIRTALLCTVLAACGQPAPLTKANPCPIVWAKAVQDSVRVLACGIGEGISMERADSAMRR